MDKELSFPLLWLDGGGGRKKFLHLSLLPSPPPAHHRKTRKRGGKSLLSVPKVGPSRKQLRFGGRLQLSTCAKAEGRLADRRKKRDISDFPHRNWFPFFFLPWFFFPQKKGREVSGCSLAPFFAISFSFFYLGRGSEWLWICSTEFDWHLAGYERTSPLNWIPV